MRNAEPAGPLNVVLKVNGAEVASGVVPVSAPLIFTANDCLTSGSISVLPSELSTTIRHPSNSTAHPRRASKVPERGRPISAREIANTWNDPITGLRAAGLEPDSRCYDYKSASLPPRCLHAPTR